MRGRETGAGQNATGSEKNFRSNPCFPPDLERFLLTCGGETCYNTSCVSFGYVWNYKLLLPSAAAEHIF